MNRFKHAAWMTVGGVVWTIAKLTEPFVNHDNHCNEEEPESFPVTINRK